MGFSGGRSLEDALSGPETDLCRLALRMLHLLDALEAFRDGNLVHTDVATDNILLIGKQDRERVMLIDYNSVIGCGSDRIVRELLDRIDGVGVIYWAPWEAGKRSVDRAIHETLMELESENLNAIEALNVRMAKLTEKRLEELEKCKAAAATGDWSALKDMATWSTVCPRSCRIRAAGYVGGRGGMLVD